MFWHLWQKGYAELAELRNIAGFENDMNALMHITGVLNPYAQEFFDQPALVFHRLRLNPKTGEKVLFNWWLGIDALSDCECKEPIVDLFENDKTVTLAAELPGITVCSPEINYINGILTVQLPKIQQKQEKLQEKDDVPQKSVNSKSHRPQRQMLPPFGNRASAKKDGSVMKVSGADNWEESPADIFDEDGCLVVILDIYGAMEESIQVNLFEYGLLTVAYRRDRELRRQVDLPCPVKRVRQQNYRNGILKIELEK
jgi:HSP20 family molecular chaperone IbpA